MCFSLEVNLLSPHPQCIFKVIVDGEGHGLCSRACLSRYQEVHGFPSCDVCSTICPDKRLVVNVEDGSKTICGDKCLVQFKEVQK